MEALISELMSALLWGALFAAVVYAVFFTFVWGALFLARGIKRLAVFLKSFG